MKRTAYILLNIFLFGSCQNDTVLEQEVSAKEQVDSAFNILFSGETSEEEQPFDISKVDTTFTLSGNKLISIKVCDSTYTFDYIEDDKILDSISENYSNSEESALAKEQYLSKVNKGVFKRDSFDLYLLLSNKKWKKVSMIDSFDEGNNTFEKHFKNFGFYSVRTQFGEGNGFKLINQETGFETRLGGRPFFSENGEYVLTISSDLEAGYNFNGFELYENKNGKLKKLIEFSPQNWGCVSASWIDKNKVAIKNDAYVVEKQNSYYKTFFTKLIINKYASV